MKKTMMIIAYDASERAACIQLEIDVPWLALDAAHNDAMADFFPERISEFSYADARSVMRHFNIERPRPYDCHEVAG